MDRFVLITGASSGIGAACALELDRQGWRVFAGVRSEDAGRQLVRQASARLAPVALDVTQQDSIDAAAQHVREAVGPAGLAGLVNNAGIGVTGPLEFLPLAELRRQFEVNTFGPLAVAQAVLPLLRAARGRIVNMSSVSGRFAAPYLGPYAASKFALEALSDSLRVELRNSGIRIALVEPGCVATPIWGKAKADADRLLEQVPPELLDHYADDFAAVRAATEHAAAKAMPVEHVVRAVTHALTAARPRTRYVVGGEARVATFLMHYLPDRAHDWLMRRSFGLK
ncbi:MAG: SDR family NAD(P)-dependent oxidoreductase [Pirellulales bacterium]|nr:SDR family NAD(P)-dependent oxidoreductase [Pirellulales bacterium]